MKICTKCNLNKPFEAFHRDKNAKLGLYPSCIECNKHRKSDKIKKAAYDKKRRQLLGFKKAASTYRVDVKILEQMYDKQKGNCAICGNPETALDKTGKVQKLAVDHCHQTGKVRGFLCSRHNKGIGMFNDDIKLLQSAIEYLNRSGRWVGSL